MTEVLPPAGRLPRYRVFHAATDIRVYDQDQLVEIAESPVSGDLAHAIASGRWLEPDVFKARLTAARLAQPEVDTLYALQAARIEFIPFQLKPLLRFMRADRPRLLVADEVGVGKTIEAGLILKELQTRQQVGNVLIVCPKALVPKWRMEMRRFDEDFRPLSAENLRYCLDETYKDGGIWPAPYARSIVHLELLRKGPYLQGIDGRRQRPGLLTLDPPPQFSLVIVDEAHHVRNPGTNSHELARLLCDLSEAVVFLSATPVHVGSENLYALLSLLRPDLFPNEAVFHEILEPNPFITEAMRHIRSRGERDRWQADAAAALERAAGTAWGREVVSKDPRFMEWHPRLRQGAIQLDADRIRCLRDVEELHSLAHVMNRTRRRDIGRFTLREPHTVEVEFTPEQEVFYSALIEFRRTVLSLEHDPRVARLITDTLERQAASCLPALVPAIDRFLATGTFRLRDASDALEAEEEEAELAVPKRLLEQGRQLRALAASLPADDPKLDQLLAIVETTLESDGPGKVLVFSFFLHTLAYLQRQLRSRGCRVDVITGQTPDEEREHLRERFRLPRAQADALDILLSSEVGCEGLDYEFCDRLVNYDIPWNPMRIEQRIGRIDRFGQTADKVLIFNFITPGTVEERIFYRCFDRLGVFRETVGDLEEVLGEAVQEITKAALDPALSPRQAELKAAQAADNAIRLIEERRRLEEEDGSLLGLDQAYMEEVDTLLAEGKFVSPSDLRLMIAAFLATPELEGRITADESAPGVYRLRLRKEGRAELWQQMRALGRMDRQMAAFMRWLQGNDPYLLVTFDQKTALERREVPFITPVHPLARLAIKHWSGLDGPLVSSLSVGDQALPAGRFLFICDLWESVSIKPEIRLVGLVYNLDTKQVETDVSEDLVRLLGEADRGEVSDATGASETDEALRQLDETIHDLRLKELRDLRERNGSLVTRKLATLDAYYRNRLERVADELGQAVDERIARMKEAEQARIGRDYIEKRTEIDSRREADIVTRRIAAGVLEIRHGE